ncbi:MAG: hypothetical protein IH905_14760, partial [Proteobacteria bacterium]|nr:hypothetical protein [Pseudomonadota bacterium]
FGLAQYIFGMHRAPFVKELVDRAAGAIVVPHPYRGRYRGEDPSDGERYTAAVNTACKDAVFSMADAVEVLNGRGPEAGNRFSQAVRDQLAAHGTGASDAHTLEEVGQVFHFHDRKFEVLRRQRNQITMLRLTVMKPNAEETAVS